MEQPQHFAPDRAMFTIFVFAMLFAPLLLPVPVPPSFAVLPIWLLTLTRLPRANIVLWSIVGSAFAVLSYVYGYDASSAVDNLPMQRLANTAIVVAMFATYTMGMATRFKNFQTIVSLFRWYIVFVFVLAVIFFINFETYFRVRGFWSYGQTLDVASQLDVLTRYTGTMSDPNNFAVSTCAIAAFLVFFDQTKIWRNIAVMAMTAIAIIASMSVTGIICYSLLAAAFVIGSPLPIGTKFVLLLGSVIVGVSIFFAIHDTQVFKLAMERTRESDTDSRFSRWVLALDAGKFIHSMIIGDGGTIILHGQDYRPHNGHIHLTYSFGLGCYIAFMAIFFRVRNLADWRHYLFLVIIFLGFTVNVGIYEHRFAGIWAALLIMYHRIHLPRPNSRRGRHMLLQVRRGSPRDRALQRRRGAPHHCPGS